MKDLDKTDWAIIFFIFVVIVLMTSSAFTIILLDFMEAFNVIT